MSVEDFYKDREHGIAKGRLHNRMTLALDVLTQYPISPLLDLGCGDGTFMEALRERMPGCECCGVEISKAAAQFAEGKGFRVITADFCAEKLPLEANSFNACFMGEVIEHAFSPDDLLAEARRVLRPDGLLFLTTPNMGAWFNRVSLLFGYQPIFTEVSTVRDFGHVCRLVGRPAGHIRVFTHRALRGLVAESGFEVMKSYGVGMANAGPLWRRLAVGAANTVFAHPTWNSGLAVLARKT